MGKKNESAYEEYCENCIHNPMHIDNKEKYKKCLKKCLKCIDKNYASYEEEKFVLTEQAIMQLILQDNNIPVTLDKANKIFVEFMELMVKSGYIQKGE